MAKSSFNHSKANVQNWTPDKEMLTFLIKKKILDYINEDDIFFEELIDYCQLSEIITNIINGLY